MSINWDDIICDEEFRNRYGKCLLGVSGQKDVDNQYPTLLRGKYKYLHHYVLPPKKGFFVDHRNGNKLDVRSCNIRYLTNSENNFNSSKTKGYEYRFGKYTAYLDKDGVRYRKHAVDTEKRAIELRVELEEEHFPGIKYRG